MDSPNRISHITELHQLRGLAAILVFFYHAMHSGRAAIGQSGWPVADFAPTALLWEGHTGVSLFLVLSGFILAMGTFGKQINYFGFLERRIRRILPLSLLVIVFGLYTAADLNFGQVMAAVFLLRNTSASFSDPSGITGTLWTVAVEFQFYLVAPFIFAGVANKGIRKFLLPLAGLFFGLKMLALMPFLRDGSELNRISYFTIVGRANQFLVGVGLAYFVHLHPPVRSRLWAYGLAIASAIILVYLWLLNIGGGNSVFRAWHLIRYEIEATIWAVFIVCFWMANPIRWKPAAGFLKYVGDVSFGLYVLHYAIQRTFWLNFASLPGSENITSLWLVAGINLVVLAVCLAAASASWFCVELPFSKRRSLKGYIT